MYVQIINFNLDGMTEEEWHQAGRRLLDDYAKLPGLLAKIWIGDAESNTFGGIYLWRDKETLDAFNKGPLGERIRNHPNYADPSFRQFRVVEELTRGTQQSMQVF